ncbi:unnamed protein product [Oppiella nova]|uniref:Uncharacterized protein n=1 Tax=Oppiella nova TaxID=334625 RepID=A0A7R9MJ62_9ACAR|nr:unnamed protein product [Oppiella nova]CAG2178281.1 unnamed protein product [Oppiella nova]
MDSKHKLLLSPVIDDNTIALMNHSKTVYLRLKLRQVGANGRRSGVEFRHSPDGADDVFVALFDDNDIDFEIRFDNRSTYGRRMAFTITYGKEYKYIISSGLSSLRALEANGNHLRFLSPNKPMANLVVDLVAQEVSMTRENAEILCSRIGGAFGFGDKTDQQFLRNHKQFIADEEFQIKPFVIELRIRDNETLLCPFEMLSSN